MTDEISNLGGPNISRRQTGEYRRCEQAHESERKECEAEPQLVPPPNLIGVDCESITPEMLTLIDLDQQQIETIVRTVPGGARNVQDIYPLTPLQEGILFHCLLNENVDTYILSVLFELECHALAGALINALQRVINRHDVLRSAVLWESLVRPVQVVHREATLPVEELILDRERDSLEQMKEQMKAVCRARDLRKPPLVWLQVAADPHGARFYAILRVHHLICDNQSLQVLVAEALAYCESPQHELPPPAAFRSYVGHELAAIRAQDAEAFFRGELGDIEEPTAPFGLLDVHRDGTHIEEAHQALHPALGARVRTEARRLGVSPARFFHAVWGLVVARTSGRHDVVYGTVLMTAERERHQQTPPMVGLFINTLPLRLRLGDVSAKEMVEQAHRKLGALLKYKQTPLTRAQRCSGMAATVPLFTTLLNYRRSVPNAEAEHSGNTGIRVIARSGAGLNYPVALMVDDEGEGFSLTARTVRSVDPHRVTDLVHTAVQSLVEALEQTPQTPAWALSIVPVSERQRVIYSFNATQSAYPQDKLIHELFEEQVQRTPDALAVVCQGQSLTYDQLNRDANQLASYLRSKGVGPDQSVGICVERSVEMVVGLLGILKAGGAYVPLDPNYPAERLVYMLRDTAPRVVLVHERLRGRLPAAAAEVIALDSDRRQIAQQPFDNVDARTLGLCTHNLAYVIYTSGSTGAPKGVAIEHQNAVNLICWARSAMDTGIFNQALQSTSLNFDLAVYECFVPLTTGGCIRVVGNAIALLEEQAEVTLINTVPSAIKGILDSGSIPETTCVVNLAGEALKGELVDRIFESSCVERVCNLYGPSETTTYSTWISMPRETGFVASIGRPIANTQVYVLDHFRQVIPIGVVGEIYIGGAGVARGYLNRPELTAERFLADPFSADPLARMYRTGDRGRWMQDGTIEYMGRDDHQVKIRGYRIELGEIEAQLVRHYQVREAVVIAIDDQSGGKRLVAYVTRRGKTDPLAKELRAHLNAVLPGYMVPSVFVILQTFPLTPNGKLDRRALPVPAIGAYALREQEPPQGELEEAVAEIWQELLQVQQVGRHASFFDLGGDSLLVLTALSRINQAFGCALTVRDMYRSPTPQQLAKRIHEGTLEEDLVDLSQEASLDDDIVVKASRRRVSAAAVMLTGGTGFVGRFVLAHLLQNTSAVVYCLVRAPSPHLALSRLRTNLSKWDLWREEFDQRIIAIPCDLRLPHLGIDELSYEILSQNVDTIYHCATSMNHLETYAMAKPANVESARELLKLATTQRLKLINYISTLSIFTSRGDGTTRIVDEMSRIDREKHSTARGYLASKWVAESIFMKAGEIGVPCNIFRLGLVWADAKHGRYDELQREYRVLKSSLLSGFGIKSYRYAMAPIPVDYVARAVVFLADRYRDGNGIFHIASSRQTIEGVFERCNEILGTSLELISLYEWISEIKRLHQAGRSLPVVPLVEFAFSMDEDAFYAHQHAIRSASIRFDCTRTDHEVETAGFVPPALNDDLLRLCVESMLSRDKELEATAAERDLVFADRESGLRLDA